MRLVSLGELRFPLPQLPHSLPPPPTLCPQSQEPAAGPLCETAVSNVLPEAAKGLRAGSMSHALLPSFLTLTGCQSWGGALEGGSITIKTVTLPNRHGALFEPHNNPRQKATLSH